MRAALATSEQRMVWSIGITGEKLALPLSLATLHLERQPLDRALLAAALYGAASPVIPRGLLAVPEDPRLPLLPLAARQLGQLLCSRGAEGVGGRLPVPDRAVDARPLGLELAPLLLLLLPTAEQVAVLGAVLGLLAALFWVQLLEPAVEVSHDVL